jgi:hypothetical protein
MADLHLAAEPEADVEAIHQVCVDAMPKQHPDFIVAKQTEEAEASSIGDVPESTATTVPSSSSSFESPQTGSSQLLVAPLSSVTSCRSGSVDGDLEPQRECETRDWDWRGRRISGEDGAENGGQPLLADALAKVCNPSRCLENCNS